ncbi:NADH-quinone oxidoreductase subunit E, partial [Yersinia pestis]
MMILTDKKPRVNVEGILTEDEIHDIEHHMGHYPYPRAACLDALKCVQRRNGRV